MNTGAYPPIIQLMEVAQGIHHFPTGPFNWYVLEEAGRLTLVDAGFPGHFGVFEDGLRRLGRQMKDVEAVVLTHAHADHMGFAERVARAAGAPVFIHAADVAASRRAWQLPWFALLGNAWRPFTGSMLGRAIANGVFRYAPVSNARAVRDGEVLQVPGRPQVIHTPGHTPGEIALFLPERRVLISGDTLVTRDLFSGATGAPRLTPPSLNGDYREAQRSLGRLRELGRVTILPGHGSPWAGEMGEAIEGALRQT